MEKKLTIQITDEAATIKLGQTLAAFALPGDVFALYGTLGMGKSVLSRAFIQSLCGPIEVPSPTFTLLQTYESDKFDIYHFDLYRLKKADEIFEIGFEEALYAGVSLIEWPERMGGYLPHDIFKLEIKPQGEGRVITIEATSPSRCQRLEELIYA